MTDTGASQRIRQRAYRRLGHLHPDEFAQLLHEEKHAEGFAHHHSPANPETIDWWGPDRGCEP